MAEELNPALISRDGGRDLAERYQRLLLDDCVPFWFPSSVDEQHGGFLHCLDRDGTLVDSDKSVWAQGRMSWMLLTLWMTPQLERDPRRADWLRWADSGLDFLQRHCFDRSAGGEEGHGTAGRMYFHVTRDGQPIRKRRYAYSESFAAIAFAAQYAVTGTPASEVLAMDLFRLFTEMNFGAGRMGSKFTATRPLIGLAPRHPRQRTKDCRPRRGPLFWKSQASTEQPASALQPCGEGRPIRICSHFPVSKGTPHPRGCHCTKEYYASTDD